MQIYNCKAEIGKFSYTLILVFLDTGYIRLEISDDHNVRNSNSFACTNINTIKELEQYVANYRHISKLVYKFLTWVDLDELETVDTPTLLKRLKHFYETQLLEAKLEFEKIDPEKRSEEVNTLIEKLGKML